MAGANRSGRAQGIEDRPKKILGGSSYQGCDSKPNLLARAFFGENPKSPGVEAKLRA